MEYLTIKDIFENEIIVNKSRFISFLYPCSSKEEVTKILNNLHQKYADATHICYAYIIFDNNQVIYKCDDNGEPASTAGMPILNLKVWLGTSPEVGVCLHENLSISIPRKYQNSVKIEAKVMEPIEAPISIGSKVGTLTYRYDNFKSKEYDLFACNNVAKANIFERGKVAIKYLLFGNSSELNETTRDINVKK